MVRSFFVLVICLALLSTGVALAAPLSPTTGATKLAANKLKAIDAVKCGQFGTKWLPIGAVPKGRFLSHARRSSNYAALAKRKSGRAAAALRAQAAKYTNLQKVQLPACAQPNGATKLAASNLKRVNSGLIQCGRLGTWYPGTLSKGYFVSAAQQGRNFRLQARFATGAAKLALAAQALSFEQKHSQQIAACTGAITNPPAPPTPLRLNLSGAAGLAISTPVAAMAQVNGGGKAFAADSDGSSNLDVVTDAGQVREAVTSGTAVISKLMTAPNGKAYLLFQQKTHLDDTSTIGTGGGCLLAEVGSDGIPTCIDSTLQSIQWSVGFGAKNPGVQFDAAGAIYYTGMNSSNQTVLRRYAAGVITDLITDNVQLRAFVVLPDGNVIVSGTTNSTSVRWYRRIAPTGGLATLLSADVEWISRFPDGNVYAGVFAGGVQRYITNTQSMEPKKWIGDATDYFDLATCNSYCFRTVSNFVQTLSGKAYAVAFDNSAGSGTLTKYFPDLQAVTTVVTKATLIQAATNDLVIAGQNASNQNVMYLHDTDTGIESQLLGPAEEIEIYHLNYSAAGSKVMFDGLRFSDNKYVLGEVNVNTGVATVTTALGTKWDDFQTFS